MRGALILSPLSLWSGNTYSRAILHDENTYPDPHAFLPDRFLNEDGSFNPALQSPAVAVFGYGRR